VIRHAHGFTLVELLVAMAVMATVGCAFVSLTVAGQSIARLQPEIADQQQRARMAVQALASDLARAGTGVERGVQAGPLGRYFRPVEPSADGGVTIWYVSGRDVEATLTAPLSAADVSVSVDTPSAFSPGSAAIVYDRSGCHDLVRVTAVTDTTIVIDAATRRCAYDSGAALAEVEVRTYRVDPAARQLQRRDETTGSTLPLLDNVAGMDLEYLDGARRLRIVVRVSSSVRRPDLPDLPVVFDVLAPNLWLS
jgi:prepilin-type N-terminal cleavage/methylation domain-containing protein